MKDTPAMSKNAQGMVSDRIETLLIQKRTLCKQEHTGDNQRQDLDSVDTETHSL